MFSHSVRPLLPGFVLRGVNLSVIAYGSSGSGKSYTVSGHAQSTHVTYSGLNTVLSGESAHNGDTLEGTDKDTVGIAYRAIREAMRIAEDEEGDAVFTFTIEYLEIYGDVVFDLLEDFGHPTAAHTQRRGGSRSASSKSTSRKPLEIREDTGEPFVAGLTTHTVHTARQAQALIAHGEHRRMVMTTHAPGNVKRKSAKSHTMLTLTCCRSYGHNNEQDETGIDQTFVSMREGYRHDSYDSDLSSLTEGTGRRGQPHIGGKDRPQANSDPDYVISRLHLVDLAGTEKIIKSEVSADRFKVSQATNRSLSTLGDVLSAIAKKDAGRSTHIPFRDSKLTYLLKKSLSGDDFRACLVTTISPLAVDVTETLSSLNFAVRCMPPESKHSSPAFKSTVHYDPKQTPRRKHVHNDDYY